LFRLKRPSKKSPKIANSVAINNIFSLLKRAKISPVLTQIRMMEARRQVDGTDLL
jgi:hypothetical protein